MKLLLAVMVGLFVVVTTLPAIPASSTACPTIVNKGGFTDWVRSLFYPNPTIVNR